MSRFLSHSICWSFPVHLKDFQSSSTLKDDVVKILDKSCSKYLFAEETGANGTNYHYDITAVFNKVQKGYDIKLKLKSLMKHHTQIFKELFDKPALVIHHLKDSEVHIRAGGYGAKEGNIYKVQGFTDEELSKGNTEYLELKSISEAARRVKQIGARYFGITVEKYIIKHDIKIEKKRDLSKALCKMIDEGYIFDMSAKTASNLFYQLLKGYIQGDDGDWINFFEGGIDINSSKDYEAAYYKYKQKLYALAG